MDTSREPERPVVAVPLARAAAYGGAVLLLAAVLWLLVQMALLVALVSASLAVAVLLTALVAPLTGRLSGLGAPRALSALLGVLVLVGVPVGVLLLLAARASTQVDALRGSLTATVEDLRGWLVDGPLGLDRSQVDRLRDSAVEALQTRLPGPMGGAAMAVDLLAAAVFVLFAVFFLLKDGPQMWAWLLGWAPARQRRRWDEAGRTGWSTLSGYVRATVLIALVDAVLIGAALLLLDVPLWLSLTLLTFLGGFVPLLGATLAGVVVVLVTLTTDGLRDALIMLVVVLLVQQVEGNVLQPVVMGRAVALHPLVILVVVSCGTLLLGIVGAVLAVPLAAVSYQVALSLSGHRSRAGAPPGD